MIMHEQIRRLQQTYNKIPAISAQQKSLCRRTISLMPKPPAGQMLRHEFEIKDPTKFKQFLLSIESDKKTCCIKVSAPKYKSRSALLIFRGRILECIYGNKKLDQPLFGREAYERSLADIWHRDNIFEAYLLTEEISLAVGSMFHGQVLQDNLNIANEGTFETAYTWVSSSGRPGCVLINDANNLAVAAAYIFNGKIVGLYSEIDGWVSNNYETALRYITKTQQPRICASMLNDNSVEEVLSRTFSPSGIDEDFDKRKEGVSEFQLPYQKEILSIKPVDPIQTPILNKFLPRNKVGIQRVKRQFGYINPTMEGDWAMRLFLSDNPQQ
jgi:hypothetical protein